MDSNTPLFSIITPVYNRADCIVRCMESVQAQQGDFTAEHVIVDDGSSDNTFALVEDFAAERHPVKALRLDRNRGTNAARNAAVRAASGRYVILLDSDDEIAPGGLATVAGWIRRYPDCPHMIFTVSDRAAQMSALGFGPGDTTVYTFRDFLEERVYGDYTHVLLRRTMLRHPYEENVRIHEGVFCLSFYKDAGEVRFVNSVVQERDRSRDDRVTFSLVPDNEATLSRHSQALAILCERFGEDLRQTAQGRSVMCRHLLKMHRFTTMLGHRSAASAAERELAAIGCPVPTLWRTLRRLRLGPAFFAVARLYVKLKFAIGIRPE